MTTRVVNVLSLGAGVQSTTLALLFDTGEITDRDGLTVRLDAAVFADTGAEPGSVYQHLEWLKGQIKTYPIIVRSKSNLKEDLMKGQNSGGQRFASIPAYTKAPGDKREGRVRRQCSKEYKVDVIERAIRRDVLGLKPRCRVPKGVQVHQWIGISLDEAGRAARLERRKQKEGGGYGKVWFYHFPLITHGWTRGTCLAWLSGRVTHQTPRSACTLCPNRQDHEWLSLQQTDPDGWLEAIEVDHALRIPGNVVNRGMDKPMYLHRSCQPLELVQLKPAANKTEETYPRGMDSECEGVCGV